MTNLTRTLVAASILMLAYATAYASTDSNIEIDVRQLTMADGLPANSIRCIHQDKLGFIWLGTINNGLCRYDGSKFTTIRPSYGEGPGLADSRISHITEDDNGHLWITTMSDQISCYDLHKEKFVDYSGTRNHMDHYGHIEFIGNETWLWGTTQGCMRITQSGESFSSETYSHAEGTLPSDKVTFIAGGADGLIWIGTSAGLCLHNGSEMQWAVTDPNFVTYAEADGRLYFMTRCGGVWRQDGKSVTHLADLPDMGSGKDMITGLFAPCNDTLIVFTTSTSYLFDTVTKTVSPAPEPYSIARAEVSGDGKGNFIIFDRKGNVIYVDGGSGKVRRMNLMLENEEVHWITRYDFVKARDGIVWISTHENGLFAYDIHNDSLQHITMDGMSRQGVSSNILMCVSEDMSGNIWIGTEFSGIFCINRIDNGASYIHFDKENGNEYSDMARTISTFQEGEVWVATRDGSVYVFDRKISRLMRKTGYRSNIYAVSKDADSTLWLGTRNEGLIIGNRSYVHKAEQQYSLSSNNIFDIQRDPDGNMWIGTFGGGLNLAVSDGKGGYAFRHYFNDSYSRRRIRDLHMDMNGMMWVGSSDGVIVFDPEKLKSDPDAYHTYNSHNSKLRSNECKAITCDSKGRIWVAETGAGFSICTPEDYSDLEFTHYSPNDGLINGLVLGFVEDLDGRMWITTEYGISCFDMETGKFRNYIFSNNMQSNVCLDKCTARLEDGRLLIGTNSGMAIIDPAACMESVGTSMNAVFTELKVNGAIVHPGEEDSPIPFTISRNPDINLTYDRNSFSLTFSTLGFTSGTRFSFFMENYDKDWSPASDMNMATYRNVPPGKYRLNVKACDPTGTWQEVPTTLSITIRPPLYRSAAAYILYILLLAAALYFAQRIFMKFAKLRNAAEIEKQLTEYKLIFFTNISHEFRTPLTLILHSMEKLRAIGDRTPAETNAIKTMETGTKRLMRLINQLLEFRKLQNDKHRLQLELTDAVEFTEDICRTFMDSAEDKGVSLEFIPSEPSFTMHLDRGDMDKVLYNLISNAIKYTPAGGAIKVSFSLSDDRSKAIFEVADTGIGIPKDRQKDIFTRFNPGESSESSMGIGLHLTKALVTANKGEIRFSENPDGIGTVMTVELPADVNCYAPEDIKASSEETAEIPAGDSLRDKVIINEECEETKPEKPINPHRILVIEDEYEIRRLIVEELCKYFNVVEAADGEAGLDIIRSDSSIELVVCDVMMPGISGYDVTSAIRSDFNTCHVPVILLTALNSEDRQLQGFQSGADAYITKPFRPNYILTRILKLLEQRNRLREKFSNDLTLKAEAICTNDKDREFMDKINAILEKNLDNPNFSMDEFASELAMGRSSFYNKVHSVTGHSPNKYIRILRMKRAAELLLTGKYTAAEVAYKVGIMDASYFSKSFKEQFGITPKAFYKQAIENLNQDSSQDG